MTLAERNLRLALSRTKLTPARKAWHWGDFGVVRTDSEVQKEAEAAFVNGNGGGEKGPTRIPNDDRQGRWAITCENGQEESEVEFRDDQSEGHARNWHQAELALSKRGLSWKEMTGGCGCGLFGRFWLSLQA